MVQTIYKIDKKEVIPPFNAGALSIDLNFDKDSPDAQVTINEWEFVRDNVDTVLAWFNAGVTGGYGITHGIPFDIEIVDGAVKETPFEGYLDLVDDALFGQDKCKIKAKERYRIDWLNDVAESFSFDYLKSIGKITEADYISVPYIVNSMPDYTQSAIAMVSVFVISQQLYNAIATIGKDTANFANPFTSISAAVGLIIYIIYLATMLVALIKLIKDLVDLIIQPVKYHSCMRLRDLLVKGADELKLTFESSILDHPDLKKVVIMPVKYQNPYTDTSKKILGFTIPDKSKQPGHFNGTFGDLLRIVKGMFNAKLVIQGTKIMLVRQDYVQSSQMFQLPPIENRSFRTNASRISSNYLVKFKADPVDKNTLKDYDGCIFQVITQPAKFSDRALVLTKGLTMIDIPFSRASRKTELTAPEEIISEFLGAIAGITNLLIDAVNAIISAYNAIAKTINKILGFLSKIGIKIKAQLPTVDPLQPVTWGNLIENRIGMMVLENDFTSAPKIFLLDEGPASKFNKVATNSNDIINAEWLYNNYHFTQSFVPTSASPTGNQYIIKNYENIPFTYQDYKKVYNNNWILDPSGKPARIMQLKWNVEAQTADAEIWFPQLYTTNLIETKLRPTG